MINLTIDNKKIEAEAGQTILEVARENGIVIPTLCSNEALEPSGACRMCVVEIKHGKRTRIVTSCLYPVAEGLVVDTKSERVLAARRLVLQLLLARCPESQQLKEMAQGSGHRTRAPVHAGQGQLEVHPLPDVRADLREGRRGLRDRLLLPGVGKERLHPLQGGLGLLHRLRRLRLCLSLGAHRDGDDGLRRCADDLGPDLQDEGLQGLRPVLRARGPAGVHQRRRRACPSRIWRSASAAADGDNTSKAPTDSVKSKKKPR